MKKIFLLGTFIFLFTITGCGQKALVHNSTTPTPPIKTVEMGYVPLPQSLFIATEKGYFKEQGLEVKLTKFANANLALEAMSRGDVQGTGAVAYSTLFAFENTSPGKFKIFSGMSENKETGWSKLIVKKGSGITSPEGLKGKKIVMRSGLSSKSQGELTIKALGLDPKDITFVQVDGGLLVQSFANQDISAFLDIEPFGTTILEKGLGELLILSPRAKYIIDPYPLSGTTFNKDFIAAEKETVQKFIAAEAKAIEFAKNPTNEKEVRTIMQKHLNLEQNVADKISLPIFLKESEIDKTTVEKLADIEVEYKVMEKKPDIQSLFFGSTNEL